MPHPIWLDQPDPDHYAAAATYLSLVDDQATVDELIALLENAPAVTYKAKDLLRVSGLPILPTTSKNGIESVKTNAPKG